MTTARNRLTQTQAERLQDSMNAAVCQKAILPRTPPEPSHLLLTGTIVIGETDSP